MVKFIIASAILLCSFFPVQAGRIGGPAFQSVVLFPGQVVFYDVLFFSNSFVCVESQRCNDLDLVVTDGFNSKRGFGFGRKIVNFCPPRPGYFRVLVKNTGLTPTFAVIKTN